MRKTAAAARQRVEYRLAIYRVTFGEAGLIAAIESSLLAMTTPSVFMVSESVRDRNQARMLPFFFAYPYLRWCALNLDSNLPRALAQSGQTG